LRRKPAPRWLTPLNLLRNRGHRLCPAPATAVAGTDPARGLEACRRPDRAAGTRGPELGP